MAIEKNTIFDYLEWRGDLSFRASPMNEVDGLIFSILAYMDFTVNEKTATLEVTAAPTINEVFLPLPEDFSKDYFINFKNMYEVSLAASKTARFGSIPIFAHECILSEEAAMQFSASSFLLPDQSLVVAFRGTDGSIVGWKEDFYMSFTSGVPAQLKSAEYLQKVLKSCSYKKIYIAGHSKGGNIAVWAAAHMDPFYCNQMKRIYDYDGPGFLREFLDSEGYQRIAPKIKKLVPASSIVGMLLESGIKFDIVASSQKGLLQHFAESWKVSGKCLVHLTERSNFGNYSDSVINSWVRNLTPEERTQLAEIIFDVLSSSAAKTFQDMETSFSTSISLMVKTFTGMDKNKKKMLNELVLRLLQEVRSETIKRNA